MLPGVAQVRTVAVAFDGLPLPGFLATDPDSINLAKNLPIPRPVALIPFCSNFRDTYIPRFEDLAVVVICVIAVRLRYCNMSEPTVT